MKNFFNKWKNKIFLVNNKNNANIENVEELIKNIKWNDVSLDGLLDFIINESKILMSSTALQNILISEFSRRFKEEHAMELNTSPDRKLLTSGSNNPAWGLNNNNHNINNNATSNSNFKGYSFTSDLIFKLISINVINNNYFIDKFLFIYFFQKSHRNMKQLIKAQLA